MAVNRGSNFKDFVVQKKIFTARSFITLLAYFDMLLIV